MRHLSTLFFGVLCLILVAGCTPIQPVAAPTTAPVAELPVLNDLVESVEPVAEAGDLFRIPYDATPDLTGDAVYFTADGAQGPGDQATEGEEEDEDQAGGHRRLRKKGPYPQREADAVDFEEQFAVVRHVAVTGERQIGRPGTLVAAPFGSCHQRRFPPFVAKVEIAAGGRPQADLTRPDVARDMTAELAVGGPFGPPGERR